MMLLLIAFVMLAQAAKIESLPGYDTNTQPALNMDSGYIGVGGSRELFYWYIEAEVNPSTAPLIFWYQGGPGCSGLAGLFSEGGPLRVAPDGSVNYNPLSWTKFASVVFLEQPAFVGFSYSDDPLDHDSNDEKSAKDNYAFVTGWLDAFPQYKGRPTWFIGESYGGIYIPKLTQIVLSDPNTQIYKQLAGIATGNPVFNCGSSTYANQMNLYYWHGLVSWSDYSDFVSSGCLTGDGGNCASIFTAAQNKIGVIDQELKKKRGVFVEKEPSLDPDCLYQDFCTGNGTLSVVNDIPTDCKSSGDLITAYLRRKDVHKAIHTSGPFGLYTETWSICSDKLIYSSSGENMVPLYQNFGKQKSGFKVLVYSGDIDIATVPFSTTNPCLNQVSSNIVTPWQPWFVNGNTAGYFEEADTYTHATVKGAGHEVPTYQPLAAFHMIQRFISGQNLTSVKGFASRPAMAAAPSSMQTKQADQLKMMLKRNGMM